MNVVILSPFFSGDASVWLDDFVRSGNFSFRKMQRRSKERSWHSRGATTPVSEWLQLLVYSSRAFTQKPSVIVVLFPPLALMTAIWSLVRRSRVPIIAWTFNLGSTRNRMKGRLAGLLMRPINAFVVHSSEERGRYAKWLGLPEQRFHFVPLQKGSAAFARNEDRERPFLLAMGSAGRDYTTLLAATTDFPGRVVIVAKEEIVKALPAQANAEFLSNLSMTECEDLQARARLTVVPVANLDTASGQVTVLTSMCYGVATIATDCPGTRDYLIDGENSLVVPPGDVGALRAAIAALWTDEAKRSAIGLAGQHVWRERFSDAAAAASFREMLERVTQQTGRAPVIDDPIFS